MSDAIFAALDALVERSIDERWTQERIRMETKKLSRADRDLLETILRRKLHELVLARP